MLNATAATWTYRPISLPATANSADRRPTVSARLMVNSTLGPEMVNQDGHNGGEL